MNSRNTVLWLFIAAGLFAFIFFFERHIPKASGGPMKVLPGFNAAQSSSVQIRPAGQLEIRAVRTNGVWQLTEPLAYPAQAASIEALLGALEQLTVATYIPERELNDRFDADEQYGFDSPQASIILGQGESLRRLRIGRKTAPGDQIFVQVVGEEGVYVVDADLLKLIPRAANDWRDTTLLALDGLAFDRVAVTGSLKSFRLQRDAASRLWRVYPIEARADNSKVEESLRKLRDLRVQQFVSDEPKADLEAFGLQPPDLELDLAQGTNVLARLQFGKSPTNDAQQVYARRPDRIGVVTVPKDLLSPWRASAGDFRDPHLFTLTAPAVAIEVRGADAFSVRRQTNGAWRVLPQDFPADAGLVEDLLSGLSRLQVVEFTKDVIIAQDLPAYGLASPIRQYVIKSAGTNAAVSGNEQVIAELQFGAGTNLQDKVYARRTDETSVYAVKLADLQGLPSASWQLRERKLWDFPVEDIAGVTIQQQGRTRRLIHNGPQSWSLAPGSQGWIEDLAVDATVSGLARLAASDWVPRGEQHLARCGFAGDGHQITLELKSGKKATVAFGGEAPSGFQYAAVTLDGEPWIFELHPLLYRDVLMYLSVPKNP